MANRWQGGFLRDDPTGALVVSGSGGGGSGLPDVAGVIRVPWATGDQSTAINAACTAARALGVQVVGVVELEQGAYQVDSPIDCHDVWLRGQGVSATSLYTNTDWTATPNAKFMLDQQPAEAGVGIAAVDSAHVGTAPIRGTKITDLTLHGPGSGADYGEIPCNLSGVRWGNGAFLGDIAIDAFFAGVFSFMDHETIRDFAISSCFYGIYFGNPSPSSGDQSIENGSIGGCKWASLGVASGKEIAGATILRTHLGNSPFNVYKEGSGTVLNSCALVGSPAENVGNANVYSEGGGDVVSNVCVALNTQNFDAAIQLPTSTVHPVTGHTIRAPGRASLDLAGGTYRRNSGPVWINSVPSPPPTVAHIDGTVVGSLGGYDYGHEVDLLQQNPGIVFATSASAETRLTSYGCVAELPYSNDALTWGDVVMLAGAGAGQPSCSLATGARATVGVALHNCSSGAPAVLIAVAGMTLVNCSANVVAGDPLTVDTGAHGKVKVATGADPIMGWALVAASSGEQVRAKLA